MRLVRDGGQLGLGHLKRLGVFHLVRPGAGSHDLDEVGPGPDLLPDRAPHVVGPVRLAVHGPVEPASGCRGRDDLAAGQHAGPAECAVAHGLAGFLEPLALGAGEPHRGHAHAQELAQFGLQKVRRGPGEDGLGAAQGRRGVGVGQDVRMGLDQARHERALLQV